MVESSGKKKPQNFNQTMSLNQNKVLYSNTNFGVLPVIGCPFIYNSIINLEWLNNWFLLSLIVITIIFTGILFMERNRDLIAPVDVNDITVRRRNLDISLRLFAQMRENNLRRRAGLPALNYNEFPAGQFTHLNFERQVILVQIIESNPIAMTRYRGGSMLGALYIRGTYRKPSASPFMTSVVFISEWNNNNNNNN